MAYGSILTDTVQSSTAATAPVFKDGNGTQIGTLCRAWVNLNGTTSPGTIRASFNVGSVTKNGTGDYTVNFTNAMPDANYAMAGNQLGGVVSSGSGARALNPLIFNTTSLRVVDTAGTGAAEDSSYITVAIFR